ncbi:LacI family DNA-binding transcriptional regulator [uncultured Corynebacterium sp.]|uniref:LacI family DNA-binding transcriptional regulator n=1 Tax=uncultured Corynebacterium sp. TaxID=159447 RepID=UPI002632DC87|nr:LacI family DNA-binding transcriptional regulator [uncultured Corynebacterium sp.]
MQSKRRRGTLASIAAELGVSRTTVSNAYNRPDQLSEKLREHILETAERLGYPGPDPMARGLRMRRVGAIGVLFTEHLPFAFDDPASVDFLAGLAEELGEMGDSMLVIPASSEEGGDVDLSLIRQAVVDGFVVYSVADNDPFLAAVRARGLPTVVCDQPADVAALPFVGIDDREAIKPAVRHLTELGHRKVGILSVRLSRTPNSGYVTEERLAGAHHQVQKNRVEGALEALAEVGIQHADVPIIERHLNDRENNRDAARQLLTENPDLTAVVCTTDTQAIAVLEYAQENGIRVPEDLSITGFDGIERALFHKLTTVIQPNRQKGIAVGRALAEELEAAHDDGGFAPATAGAGKGADTDSAGVGSASADGKNAAPSDSSERRSPRVLLETEFVVGATTAAPSAG